MQLYEQLKGNKGLVSSALSKKLATRVLEDETSLLAEAVGLLKDNDPSVRSACAKIIEIVAETRPELVSPHLEKIVPCLSLPERQTRWMAIHIVGCCSAQKPLIAEKALPKAVEFLNDKESGTCLKDRSIVYLGQLCSVSKKHSKLVLPVLLSSIQKAPDRAIRVIDGIDGMIDCIGDDSMPSVVKFLNGFIDDKRTNVMKKAKNVLKKLQKIKGI